VVVATVPELLAGQLLDGRYRIVGRIARGGMATVYEALDTRLHREVAVKVMHAALARDEDFVDRFIREARSAARLSHPNVVAVFDQGSQHDDRTGEDCVYLVMELVRGRTLRQLLRERGPLSPVDALAVLEPVLAALRAAHDAGIVHRDVKPENVLLADDGRVEVADFGLARAVDAVGADTATRGVLLGTVSYLAPEQVVEGRADARTDVYSAGIVLFEMLTGCKPHEGDTPMSVAYKHVNDDVPRPSALRPGIPPAVDRLVRRATDRDADRRFADGREFLDAVRSTRELLRRHPDRPLAGAHALGGRPDAGRRPTDPGRAGASPAGSWAAASGAPGAGPLAGPLLGGPLLGGPPGGSRGALAGPAPTPGGPQTVPAGARAGGDRTLGRSAGPVEVGVAGAAAGFDARAAAGFDARAAAGASAAGARSVLAAQRRRTLARRRRRRGVAAVVGVVLLALVVGALAWYVGVGRFAAVPRLSGLPEVQAEQQAQSAGLRVRVAAEAWDDATPAGYVISASDPARIRLPRGATVGLVVSRGAQRHVVAAVVGMQRPAAVAALARVGLLAAPVRGVWDAVHPVGQVLSTDPAAGQSVSRATPVVLTVSRGPQPVDVPDVVGQGDTAASTAVSGAGVDVALVQSPSATVAAGHVIAQHPAAGPVSPATVVTLVVSTGPAPVAVPWSVLGQPTATAVRQLSALGLHVQVRRSDLYVGLGRVVSAGGLAGTRVAPGSTVVLSVL